MNRWHIVIGLAGVMVFQPPAEAVSAGIKKVLPHYLDREGRHTLAPSLYERDAYQAYLRRHPKEQAAIRFDVLLKAPASTNLVLRIELRGTREEKPTTVSQASSPFAHPGGRAWKSVTLAGDAFPAIGKMVAWKVTLWEGDRLVTEQRSFLW